MDLYGEWSEFHGRFLLKFSPKANSLEIRDTLSQVVAKRLINGFGYAEMAA
jgi:hypothetical protein